MMPVTWSLILPQVLRKEAAPLRGGGKIATGILSSFGGCGGKDNSKLTDNFFIKIKTRTTT